PGMSSGVEHGVGGGVLDGDVGPGPVGWAFGGEEAESAALDVDPDAEPRWMMFLAKRTPVVMPPAARIATTPNINPVMEASLAGQTRSETQRTGHGTRSYRWLFSFSASPGRSVSCPHRHHPVFLCCCRARCS